MDFNCKPVDLEYMSVNGCLFIFVRVRNGPMQLINKICRQKESPSVKKGMKILWFELTGKQEDCKISECRVP